MTRLRVRVCLDCPTAYAPSTVNARRCPPCARKADRDRGTKAERGYGPEFATTKAAWQRRIDAGEPVACWRCTKPILGRDWHLGHDDHDRSIIRGPECPPCNLRAAGRASHGLPPS